MILGKYWKISDVIITYLVSARRKRQEGMAMYEDLARDIGNVSCVLTKIISTEISACDAVMSGIEQFL